MAESRPLVLVLLEALRADGGSAHSAWGPRRGRRGLVTGAVRENFGFLTRPAYFAGLSSRSSGMMTMMVRQPHSSPFRALRKLPVPLLRAVDGRPLLNHVTRRVLHALLRRRRDAVRFNGSALDVPLELLPEFDFSEKLPPWAEYAGRPSIFGLVAAAGGRFTYIGYPYVSAYGSDADTLSRFRREVDTGTRLAFVQFNELDRIGHEHGPDGPEYAAGVAAYQELMRGVTVHCRGLFGEDWDLIAFGDHGMVGVERTLDIPAALATLPSRVRSAVVPFYDSTLARFWSDSPSALAAVRERLECLDGGAVVTPERARHFELPESVADVGDLLFLAEPGTVLHPNWFSRRGRAVKGMHGYDPACTDNLGALWMQSLAIVDSDVGVVPQVDLFATAVELLGLAVPPCDGRSLLSRLAASGTPT
jgi:hypothetical protein